MTQHEINIRNTKEIDKLIPSLQVKANELIRLCHCANVAILVYSGLRTFVEQNAEYAKGRTILKTADGKRQAKVTKAMAGQSYHNYGLAFDCAPVVNGKIDWSGTSSPWRSLGALGKSLGLTWGGDWKMKDLPHFEYRNGVHWSALLAAYKLSNGDLRKCWHLVEDAGKR